MPTHLTIEAAAHETALPARTIRAWVAAGKLASLPPPAGSRGRRVNLADVRRLASAHGRATASGKVATAFHDSPESTPIFENSDDADLPAAIAVTAGLPAGLLQLRDEWTLPFVEKIGQLERENGAQGERIAGLEAQLAEFQRSAVASHADRQDGGILGVWWARLRARFSAIGGTVV